MTQEHPAGRVPVVEVVITDQLDLWAIPTLSALIDEALELHPVQLVLDLAGCPFMDAAVIGLLLETHRRLRYTGGLLTLRSPSPRLARNLRLARVDRVLHVTGAADAPAGTV